MKMRNKEYSHIIDGDMDKVKTTPSNIRAYLLGSFRYKVYYSKYFKWLIRVHIQEQIEFRIKIMNQECYDNGSCEMCGCTTTALQMANKSCEKPCYPPMFNENNWIKFAGGAVIKGWSAKTETRKITEVEGGNVTQYVEKIYYIYKNNELVHSKMISENGMGTKNN